MTRIHFSNDSELLPHSQDQEGGTSVYGKPAGLWYSMEDSNDGWASWCEGETFPLGSWEHVVEVNLEPMCVIRDGLDLEVFAGRFGIRSSYDEISINWERVAQEFSGIEISPYLWSHRMAEGSRWYYGWDCASGCVWDASCIKAVGPPTYREEKYR